MALIDQLNDDLKAAMKAKDTVTRDTLRMVLTLTKNQRIELGRELEDADVMACLQRSVKTRRDSIEQYEKAGRDELAAIEKGEIAVLDRYLPKLLSEDETRALVSAKIAELGLTQKRELGQLMKAVLGEHQGTVDGKLVSRLAGEQLA
ncbi:MAG: GatB/YqeY domain-containing protein [Planctomycetota bacterium]|nr:GatB/YqeY domain-containing protein [Planctomycetota bacterium]